MRKQDAGSVQARHVAAFLHYCLAQSSARTNRVDDAVGLFRQAISEMEALCVEFPWNGRYWELARYFQRETARMLQSAQRQEAAKESIEQMVDWLQKTGPRLPDDPVPQSELQHCRTDLISLLKSVGKEDRAQTLQQAVSGKAISAEAAKTRIRATTE
jgi:hypothetical protein